MATAYPYPPLRAGMPIRLLRLDRGEFSDPILTHLISTHIPIGDKLKRYFVQSIGYEEHVEFEALSYAWGSTSNRKPIYVRGLATDDTIEDVRTIMVTENLESALRHLRKPTENRNLWVDAVCIDQNNIEERNQQVALMGNVYAQARRVLVWLGPEYNNSNLAMEALEYLGERFLADVENSTLGPLKFERHVFYNEYLTCGAESETALGHLFSRPWFERFWVQQEVSLARHPIVHCGLMNIKWETFVNAVYAINFRKLRVEFPLSLSRKLAFNIVNTKTFLFSYRSLREDSRYLKCTDLHDYIYAIQSILRQVDASLGITTDYSIEPSELFTEVCWRLATRSYDTQFLSSCELSSTSLPNLPTWVPDWSCPPRYAKQIYSSWSACGWISAQVTTTCRDGKILRVSGVQAAKVERLCDVSDEGHTPRFGDITKMLCKFYKVEDAKSLDEQPYIGGGTLLDACLRALVLNGFYEKSFTARVKEPTFAGVKKGLVLGWDLKDRRPGLADEITKHMEAYESRFREAFEGRSFFCSSEGYIGLVPHGTRHGDIICAVLGCAEPIVLRQTPVNDGTRWQVVGACWVQGLMDGEAIYGPLPYDTEAIQHAADFPPINDYRRAIRRIGGSPLRTDPEQFLIDMGIRPTRYQRNPHVLEVAPEVLQEAGVNLQDFDLI